MPLEGFIPYPASLSELNVATIFLNHHFFNSFVGTLAAVAVVGAAVCMSCCATHFVQRVDGGLQLLLVNAQLSFLLCEAL